MAGVVDWLKSLLFKSDPDGAPKKRDALGDRGENVAARYLQKQGYRIIERNVRSEAGEIDIVARDGKVLVFVEVKTRAYDDPTPEDQVNAEKQRRLTRAAKAFLTRYGTPQPPARFDVVAVLWPTNQDPIIRHTPNAFDATE